MAFPIKISFPTNCFGQAAEFPDPEPGELVVGDFRKSPPPALQSPLPGLWPRVARQLRRYFVGAAPAAEIVV